MNERIQQLAVQAGWDNHHSKIDTRIEKIAQVIVRECTRIVINNGIATATHDQMVRQDCVNEIKEHFGVEE